ncbi:uncharacterized protein Dwil_GK28249 [Drosophila willistoni]|uniref:Uncharacterized protein n=1 Tax=Drosophila willistoni TaxID=7260 RepID=A0A0Q9X0K4_DROWI|nr:uncharacterized protein Dwil_GK28249 [Drosophila willistoni]
MMHKICYWCWLQELICSCADVHHQQHQQPPPRADDDYDADIYVNDYNKSDQLKTSGGQVPNPLALLRTVAALIALDANPHHQHMRYLQQQQELQLKLQQSISSCIQQQEQINGHDNGGHVKCKLYELPPGSRHHQQSQFAGTMSHLLRQAKQKTYERIKNNLLSAHGQHSFQASNNNNNRNSSVVGSGSGLQTIVENEHDVASAGPAGHYQLIDEKDQEKEKKLTTLGTTTTNPTATPTLFKRIEFFEQNGLTKPKLEVFSIYRVGEQHHQQQQQQQQHNHQHQQKVTLKLEQKHKLEQLLKTQDSGNSFLKHDSHTLTIILSCVFMFTFLWLVFFPLPG